jgi:hypothetical protein
LPIFGHDVKDLGGVLFLHRWSFFAPAGLGALQQQRGDCAGLIFSAAMPSAVRELGEQR